MRWRRWLRRLLVAALIAYLAICAFLYFAQDHLLFPVDQVGPDPALPPGSQRLSLPAATGERLRGVHIPPVGLPSGLLVLGFGGNAANAAGTAGMLHVFYPDADVVVFAYRGYPPSGGHPGAAAFRADAVRIHDSARARLRPRRVVAVGFSVGSGVAASLARSRPLDGVILVTPFDSLERVAAGQYPWVPVWLLFRHDLDSARALSGRAVPVAVIAAGEDGLVPPERTAALRRAILRLAYDRTLPHVGHNSIYRDPAFAPAMEAAMRSLLAAGSR
jgi:pimeloyl-ACP methyl ester carboxylesterase